MKMKGKCIYDPDVTCNVVLVLDNKTGLTLIQIYKDYLHRYCAACKIKSTKVIIDIHGRITR